MLGMKRAPGPRDKTHKLATKQRLALCSCIDVLNIYYHRKYPHLQRTKRARFRAEETRRERGNAR